MNRHRQSVSSDSKKYFDWLEIAATDLLASRLLLEQKQCLNIAAFHCQQCLEKSFKGYLLFKVGRLYDGHNLTWLCKQAVRQNAKFKSFLAVTSRLNRFYIETRYPADVDLGLTYAFVEDMYAVSQKIYDTVCKEVYNEDNSPILQHF